MKSQGYEEFLDAFRSHGVKFLVIGAHAVAHHARPRATKDLDILIEPTQANARKALAALREFLGGDFGYKPSDLLDQSGLIQFGVAPTRIDVMSNAPGCDNFNEIWKNRVEAPFGAAMAFYVGFDDLIQLKLASGRPQDLVDVRMLRKQRKHPKKNNLGK